MRKFIVTLSAAAFAFGVAGATLGTTDAFAKGHNKTTLGCVKGKEKWNATLGKCEAVKKKAVKKAGKKKK
jgi:hypothetical protein